MASQARKCLFYLSQFSSAVMSFRTSVQASHCQIPVTDHNVPETLLWSVRAHSFDQSHLIKATIMNSICMDSVSIMHHQA
jgi:hypothetical protein